MVNFTRFDSIISLASYFSNEEICRQFLKEQRWGSVVVCPYCGSVHVYACGDGKRFKCDGCGNKFSVLVGTIFENTKLPLRKWFMAMYLLSSHKKGVSSHQIARDIEVTQKTAWFMLHKIRTLLGQEDNVTLADEVECDEAYMGGREKNKHESKRTEATRGRSTKTKTPVFGMVQRGGKVELPKYFVS
jgi:transposase-like protein